ncbi:hypothetical protein OPV22_008389 [Ensete ventricosum]|uniref:HotDog ACOT-type domain-containing protein n=1 Tax=Ensete ventricosum TaxID=4639 RepID=A0AAV8RGV6_ENSVE|nr:hypothetical protein OPV22_008389 [Ensete ventricosum]
MMQIKFIEEEFYPDKSQTRNMYLQINMMTQQGHWLSKSLVNKNMSAFRGGMLIDMSLVYSLQETYEGVIPVHATVIGDQGFLIPAKVCSRIYVDSKSTAMAMKKMSSTW